MSASYTGPIPTGEPTGKLGKGALEQLWENAGGTKSAAPMAAAIALAESSGEVNSTDDDSNGTIDRGLWQINSIHGTLSTFVPSANARAAVALSANGTNWTPWVTYNTGAYKKYLTAGGNNNSATTNTTTPSTSTGTNAATPPSNPLLPTGRGSGDALKYLIYAVLFATGTGLAYIGITRAAGKHPLPGGPQ